MVQKKFIGRASFVELTTREKVKKQLGYTLCLLAVIVSGCDRICRFFLPAAGNYNGTSLNNFGSNGYYWSSSWNSSSNAYNLNFNSSNVNPQNNVNRRCGFSVRAVQHSL